MTVLVIVDAANVVGSVPNGWWRDRLGAARRLRDALAQRGVPIGGDGGGGEPGEVEVVLVVEGAARALADEESPEGVRVVAAAGSGDDTIAELAAAAEAECVVVTADRGLRDRVLATGARVLGPRTVPYP